MREECHKEKNKISAMTSLEMTGLLWAESETICAFHRSLSGLYLQTQPTNWRFGPAVLRVGSLQGDHNETSHDHPHETRKGDSYCGVGIELILNKRYLSKCSVCFVG